MKKRLNNLIKGEIGNEIAINWFLNQGYTVYKPVVDIERIDFIARRISKRKFVTPCYYEIQVKKSTLLSFYVPRREFGWSSDNYFYVFVQLPKKGQPDIYLMTQEEVKKLRYTSTRKLKNKMPKSFKKNNVVVKISNELKKKYDINNRKDLLLKMCYLKNKSER